MSGVPRPEPTLRIVETRILRGPNYWAREPVVRMLVDLASKTGAKTLAEGIETVEEYDTCRELGIDLMQGYYLAHPHEQLSVGEAEVAKSVGTR